MPTFPVRRLGSAGIVTDTHPSDLEDPAIFTAGVNVRFRNGRISRAPVARTVRTLPFEPDFCFTIPPASGGYDQIILTSADFAGIYRLNGVSYEDLTPIGHTGSGGTVATTASLLGGVAYLNRGPNAPIDMGPGDSTFETITDWNPSDRC